MSDADHARQLLRPDWFLSEALCESARAAVARALAAARRRERLAAVEWLEGEAAGCKETNLGLSVLLYELAGEVRDAPGREGGLNRDGETG